MDESEVPVNPYVPTRGGHKVYEKGGALKDPTCETMARHIGRIVGWYTEGGDAIWNRNTVDAAGTLGGDDKAYCAHFVYIFWSFWRKSKCELRYVALAHIDSELVRAVSGWALRLRSGVMMSRHLP